MTEQNKKNLTSSLLQEEIINYSKKTDTSSVGKIISVGDGICTVYGLDKCMLGELVEFEDKTKGMVMNLNEDSVGIVLFSSKNNVCENQIVKRTNEVVKVPVGDEVLGRVIDPLGNPMDGLKKIEYKKYRPIERVAYGVMERKSVTTPLETGIKIIDLMIPIGRGQRELIIGDRQTGKTQIALDTIINQKNKNCYCIYVAIGQKDSSVVRFVEQLKKHDCLSYTTIINAPSSELDPIKYIAPYAGVTIAEEWMEQGKDVLIVYDDLSKHAVSYRTLCLLLKRSVGREAYPGDVFYLHSRLLERSCRLSDDLKGGSITALPIIETQNGDISAYIPTNVISITDGQIFLDTEMFNSNIRPSIDVGLSVSRVGSACQFPCMKNVSKSLKIEIANYNELKAFASFGSDLDKQTAKTLKHGKLITEILKQKPYEPLPFYKMVIEMFCVNSCLLDDMNLDEVQQFIDNLYSHIELEHKDMIEYLIKNKDFDEKFSDKLNKIIKDYYTLRVKED